MFLTIKLIVLLLSFGVLFSFIPKFTYKQVKKLLVYHKYSSQPLKNKIYKVIRVYTILGLTLGLVFMFLLSPDIIPKINDLTDTTLFPRDILELVGLSFFLSFIFVFVLRITTLLNKSKIYSWFLSDERKNIVAINSQKYDYVGLKNEISSFLFSIFLTALLGIMVYFVYNLLFNPTNTINLNVSQNYSSLGIYSMVIIGFMVGLVILASLGEWVLFKVGVHPNCEEEYKE